MFAPDAASAYLGKTADCEAKEKMRKREQQLQVQPKPRTG
jgi:hypothetical protein